MDLYGNEDPGEGEAPRIKKVILQADGPVVLPAKVAEKALQDGPPTDGVLPYRTYETNAAVNERLPKALFAVKFNKASITVYPQPWWQQDRKDETTA
jgi:hypothetical protein